MAQVRLADDHEVFEELDFQALLEGSAAPMLVVDSDLFVRWLNPAGEAFIGIAKTMAVGKSLGSLVGPTHVLLADARRVLDRGINVTIHDVSIRTPSGPRNHTVSLSYVDLKGHSAIGLVIHPSSSVENEQQSLAAEQSSAASRHIHHVLDKNLIAPVTALRGALQIIAQSDDPDERAELWSILGETSLSLMNLGRSAAALGVSPAGSPGPVNLHQVIDSAIKGIDLIAEKRIRIDRAFDPSLPRAQGWVVSLKAALFEIIKNAAEAAPADTGVIRIVTRFRHEPPVVNSQDSGPRPLPLEVVISDNGPGLPSEIENIAFFPFVSGQEGHAGLGLTVAVQGISRHGGRLTMLRKAPGQQVTISLPRVSGDEDG